MTPTPRRTPLDLVRLQEAAGPPWRVSLHAEAGSTNALASAEPDADHVVVADHQQAGRGRLDRAWVTPPGAALTFSAVCDPGVDTEWWPVVPLVAGYAVARAIGDVAALKWPNDVLVGDRKVCGILVERVNTRPPLAVVGIGVNVDQTDDELPVPTATSLALAGHPVDRTELFGGVLRHLRESLDSFAASPAAFVDRYRARSATLGEQVRVDLPGDRSVTGRVSDIDAHGGLVLDTDDGTVTLSAGDVVHLRPGE
jgi:BirA family transcriptional regulator, biotin operon repressor / biotin---[acetyl-CoA-carboxylase] ligase